MTVMEYRPKKVVVVGSGVLGLSIALQLKVQGNYRVTIIARDLPSDTPSRQFASPWAGANWASTTSDPRQQALDEATFKQWQNWQQQLPQDLITEMPFTEYTHPMAENKQVEEWRSRFLPGYQSTWIDEETKATKFTGLTMNAPAFLAYLESELHSTHSKLFPLMSSSSSSSGSSSSSNSEFNSSQIPATFIRADVSRLSDIFDYVPDAQLIINATALGSRNLKDVQDSQVYPIRGQTVLIRPSKRFQQSPRCVMKGPKTGNFNVDKSLPEDQEFTYVIPRARSGQVICGGCAIPNDWNTILDEEMSKRILQRCIKVVPELLEEGIDPTSKDAWKTLDILSHGLGLRPARKGGLRLEMEDMKTSDNRLYHVLHAYGAGGGGYQSGYGTAAQAFRIVDGFFNKSKLNVNCNCNGNSNGNSNGEVMNHL